MILGVDPGERRVGVALADEETRFATPLEVIDVTSSDPVARIGELVTEYTVTVVVVGRPLSLSGEAAQAVAGAAPFVAALREALPVEVVEHDERLTTVIAERSLRAGGAGRETRKRLRDAVAAQVMLQGYLDARTGRHGSAEGGRANSHGSAEGGGANSHGSAEGGGANSHGSAEGGGANSLGERPGTDGR